MPAFRNIDQWGAGGMQLFKGRLIRDQYHVNLREIEQLIMYNFQIIFEKIDSIEIGLWLFFLFLTPF